MALMAGLNFDLMVCTLSPVLIPFSKIVPYGIPLADERTTREAQVSELNLEVPVNNFSR